MNKKNIIIICICFAIAIVATVFITIGIMNYSNNEKENKTNIKEKNNSINNNLEEENKNLDELEETIKENPDNIEINENNSSQNTSKPNKSEIPKEDNPVIKEEKSEEDIINYVEDISTNSTGDKLKSGFIKVVDFLFYNGEIYDKTFSELSNSAKIKIIELALKIDSKIDEYFPGYKESISNTTTKVYTNIKTKLVTLYLDTTVKICNNNPTLCEDAKEGLEELKKNFGLTWDFIKDISGIGLTKLKDWYEVWKEE